jgi:hypothetical protein
MVRAKWAPEVAAGRAIAVWRDRVARAAARRDIDMVRERALSVAAETAFASVLSQCLPVILNRLS